MNRLLRMILGTALLLPIGLAASASPAAAFGKVTHCSGTYLETYEPGITNTPQDVQATTSSNYTSCTSTDHSITSASSATGGTIPDAACVDLFQPPSSGQTTLTWNTGETTVYNWTATAVQLGDTTLVIVTGTVIAGKFLGAKILRKNTFIQQTLESQCATSQGLQQTSGPATLTITKLL